MSGISVLTREVEVLKKGFEVVSQARGVGIDVRDTQSLLLSQFASCLERCRAALVDAQRVQIRKSMSADIPRAPIRKSFAMSGNAVTWLRVGNQYLPFDSRTGVCCAEIVDDMDVS